MKRYDIEVQIVREEGIEAAIAEMVTVSDLHAWALKHKATVEGMDHHRNCSSNYDYFDGECNCIRGDALREIKVLLNG